LRRTMRRQRASSQDGVDDQSGTLSGNPAPAVHAE
jgi:hypothetical protein